MLLRCFCLIFRLLLRAALRSSDKWDRHPRYRHPPWLLARRRSTSLATFFCFQASSWPSFSCRTWLPPRHHLQEPQAVLALLLGPVEAAAQGGRLVRPQAPIGKGCRAPRLMLVLLPNPSKSCVARTDAAPAGLKESEVCQTSGPHWLHLLLFQPSLLQVVQQLMPWPELASQSLGQRLEPWLGL